MSQQSRKPGRGERHSAAWGKRLGVLVLAFVAQAALAQRFSLRSEGNVPSFRVAPELRQQLAKAQRGQGANQTVKVIVQYRQVPQASHYSRMHNLGGQLQTRLHMIRSAAFTIPVSALPALEADPEIVSVTIDHPLQLMDDYTDAAANVSAAWNAGFNGTGVGVAVIDSGINDRGYDLWDSTQAHSRVVYHQDFTGTPTTNANGAQYDLYGHGTHVAGIIGGNGYQSAGRYAGVAPNANLIDLRALDANGSGTDSSVIAAIQQAIALQNTYNIRVINLSLGRGIPQSYATDPLCQAVEAAWNNGIVVVVAAGNYGRLSINGSNGFGTITAPGNDPFVITVGAMKSMGTYTRTDDRKASYSSKGPTTYDFVVKPDIMADGNLVRSVAAPGTTLAATFPGDLASGSDGNNDYLTLSGTSMATPAVAGAVALLLQQNSALTPDQVKARLMKTAYKSSFPQSSVSWVPHLSQSFTDFYDLFSMGSGYLDVQAALNNTDLAPATVGSALSPSVNYNSNGTVSLVNGNATIQPGSVVWGTSVVWGMSVVWGPNVSGMSVVWGGQPLPWSDSSLSAFSVVWGTKNAPAGSSVVWGGSPLATNTAYSDAGDDEQ